MTGKRISLLGLSFLAGLAALLLAPPAAFAAGPAKPPEAKADEPELTPEQKMQKRYPQPVKAGFLVGLPVLDDNDSTIGFVTQVVRDAEGKVHLIVPYGGWFGRGGRPVAVPLETVAIAARQIAAIDMARDEFDDAPTWNPAEGKPIDANETLKIALYRR